MNVRELTEEQLIENLKKYEVDAPRTASRVEKEDLLIIELHKREIALQEKAKYQRQNEISQMLGLDPQTKARPAPETIQIMESPKVYARFENLEEKGVDVEFNKGCTHTFHLWHGFLHVLPKCIIDEARDRNSPSGKVPIHGKRRSTARPGIVIDTIIGHERRYSFEIQDTKPPKNAQFGVVLDRKIYNKLGLDFPMPETAEAPVS